MLLSVIAVLLGFQHLSSTIGFNSSKKSIVPPDSSNIRLMTYNVHHFKLLGTEVDTSARNNIFNLIEKEQPDIIAIQEFYTRKKGKFKSENTIKDILNTRHYHFYCTSGNDYESMGIAIFSKLPIIRQGNLTELDPKGANNGLWIDVQKDDQVLRVYTVHLASIAFSPTDYYYFSRLSKMNTENEDLVHGKKIASRLKSAFVRRAQQVKVLKNYTDSCTTPYVIMGDFNDTPVSYSVHQISQGLKNSFKEKGSGIGITYNGEFPNFQIDYVFTSPQFTINSYKILKAVYSDHYPVKVDVRLDK